MGNVHSSAGTQFIGTDGLPVAQSYQPCHIFGDPDLYGMGIRYGFYFQYLGAAIAIMSEGDDDFRVWRASFTAVAVATFISLCINVTGDSIVILDWSIMMLLVLWFPLYVAFPVIYGSIIHHVEKEGEADRRLFRDRLQRQVGQAIGLREAEVRRAISRVWHEYRTLNSTVGTHPLANAIQRYIEAYEQPPDPGEPSDGLHPELALPHLNSVYNPRFLEDIRHSSVDGARRKIGDLPENHEQAIQEMGLAETVQSARQWDRAVRIVTKRERKAYYDLYKLSAAFRKLERLGFLDKATAGVALLTHSGFCFLTPWLFFTGIDRGVKAGCDVRLLNLFAPLSIHNTNFTNFLKFFACSLVIVGIVTFIIGAVLLGLGLMSSGFDEQHPEPTPSPDWTAVRPPTTWIGALYQWVRAHVLGPEEPDDLEPEDNAHGHRNLLGREFPRIQYGVALLLLLITNWILVEQTIIVNGLDMRHQAFTSTGELIAFILGVLGLVVVVHNAAWRLYVKFQGQLEPGPRRVWIQTRLNGFLVRILGWLYPRRTTTTPHTDDETGSTDLIVPGQPLVAQHQPQMAQVPRITGPRVQELHSD